MTFGFRAPGVHVGYGSGWPWSLPKWRDPAGSWVWTVHLGYGPGPFCRAAGAPPGRACRSEAGLDWGAGSCASEDGRRWDRRGDGGRREDGGGDGETVAEQAAPKATVARRSYFRSPPARRPWTGGPPERRKTKEGDGRPLRLVSVQLRSQIHLAMSDLTARRSQTPTAGMKSPVGAWCGKWSPLVEPTGPCRLLSVGPVAAALWWDPLPRVVRRGPGRSQRLA